MNSRPPVQPGEWILIGDPTEGTCNNGLVLGVYADYLAVGYFQNRIKAIKEDVIWRDGHWHFRYKGPTGSYLHGAEEAAVKRGPPRTP